MIEWKHGKNDYQEYYDANVGGHYLCVFNNKWEPGIWMGMYDNNTIHNKTRNDRERRKNNLPKGSHFAELQRDWILCSPNPEYMMRKVEYCFKHKQIEISE